MTFTLSQHNVVGTSAATVTSTAFSPAITTSQLVIGAVAFGQNGTNSTTITSVKDNAPTPNSYPLIGSIVNSATGGVGVQLFWLDAPPGAPTTITAVVSASTLLAIYVASFNRGNSVSTDQTPTGTSGSSATPTGPSITPSVANALVFACAGEDAGVTATATSPLLKLDQDGLIVAVNGYVIQTSIAAISPSFATGATSSTWSVAAASFKEAGAVTCIRGGEMLLGVGCWAADKIAKNPSITRRNLIVPRLR